MEHFRRVRRILTRRPWPLVGAALSLAVLGLAAISIRSMPAEAPATSTASRYADLFAHRLTRTNVHAEVVPASVLQGAIDIPAVARPELYPAALARVRISRIGVDAPIDAMDLTADGTMESPRGPDVVAWYRFTPKPGLGGNAVLSGHVDYINHGPAVFWDLRRLQPGDDIDVLLADGTVLQYAVTALQLYALDQVPMKDVLAQTSTESITIITCGGTFSAGAYTHRLVLRAVRTGVTHS